MHECINVMRYYSVNGICLCYPFFGMACHFPLSLLFLAVAKTESYIRME